jgi:hypothetical protein
MKNAQQIMQAVRDAFAKDLTRFVGQQDRSGWTLTLSGINKQVERAYGQLYPDARVDVTSELKDDGTVDVSVRIYPRYITVEFTVEPSNG